MEESTYVLHILVVKQRDEQQNSCRQKEASRVTVINVKTRAEYTNHKAFMNNYTCIHLRDLEGQKEKTLKDKGACSKEWEKIMISKYQYIQPHVNTAIKYLSWLTSDGDGDEETDEEEDEEDAETALVLADGAAAAEEPDDHDDGAQDEQSDGEHPHHVWKFN